jgi:hypothetical protein
LAITGGVENAENGSESGLIWCNSQAVTFFVTLAFSAFSYSHLKWDNSNLKWDTLSFKVGRNMSSEFYTFNQAADAVNPGKRPKEPGSNNTSPKHWKLP